MPNVCRLYAIYESNMQTKLHLKDPIIPICKTYAKYMQYICKYMQIYSNICKIYANIRKIIHFKDQNAKYIQNYMQKYSKNMQFMSGPYIAYIAWRNK